MNTLTKTTVQKNPFKQFEVWFREVLNSGIKEPFAMILATSTGNGKPSARTVLLKGYDEKGFLFFTNYESRKGKELINNPVGELLFYWMDFQRQVRIYGKVEKISRKESEEYFKTRPVMSRISAWASRQSKIIPDRKYLEKQFAMFEEKFKDDVPLPPNWGGFRVIPDRFEFWQGRENRLHDRIYYRKKKDEWEIERLAP